MPSLRNARLFALLLLAGCQNPAQNTVVHEPPVTVVCAAAQGPMLSGISSIHVGSAITCAVVSGRVACWGINDLGRLGDGFDSKRRDVPFFIPGLSDVEDVTFGNDATFARFKDGTVAVWGPNRGGEFGDGSPDFHIAWEPRRVPDWGKVTKIRGGIPTCAIREDKKVECTGKPRFRRMGEDRAKPGNKPRVIDGLEDIDDIAAGAGFTCALRHDGAVFCWGMDDYGQLGDSGGDDKAKPVRVRELDGAIEISADGDTACARVAKGGVYCWGRAFADSAIGESSPKWLRPERIEGTERAIQISSGDRVGCALIQGGDVRCWGEASYDGQLGDGTSETRPTEAKPVACVRDAIAVGVGRNHSCALLRDGTARCWGSGPYGAIGDNSAENRPLPVAVKDATPLGPPEGRCPPGSTYQKGPAETPAGASAESCEGPDGKRVGHFVERWPTGGLLEEGNYEAGERVGRWLDYYEHGEVVSENFYDHGKPHGLWIAYTLHYIFAFATCFDHGQKSWQVTDEQEARTRHCP